MPITKKNEAEKIIVTEDQKSDLKPIETIKELKTPKKKISLKTRFRIACFGLISIITLSCLLVFSFLWFGGYVNDWVCGIVKDDSSIAKRFSCTNESVKEEGEGEFRYNVVERDGEIKISDQETLLTDVVENSSNSVVSIGIKGDEFSQDQVIGTGFIVSENGLIVTNQHVVSGGEEADFFVITKNTEEQIPVDKIYRDSVNDLAFIKVDATGLSVLPLGDSEKLRVGQTVIAIGNPLGNLTGSVTSGIISALDRDVQVGEGFFNSDIGIFEGVIQTDAAVNPGNSGGPLIDLNGDVIGVNFATIQGADNLSFAIPINRVKQRINELNEYGKFRIPYIGVEYRRRVVFYENDAVVGALVVRVVADSPAAQAGVLQGDIVVQYDGMSVEDVSLFNLIQKSEIGKEIDIVVLRSGQQVNIKLKVGER